MFTSHQVLQEIFQDHPVKQLAPQLNLAYSTVSKWAETCHPEAVSPVERTGQLLEALEEDDRLIQHLCQRAGEFFVRNPPVELSGETAYQAENQLVRASAEYFTEVTVAVTPAGRTPNQVQRVRRRWDTLKTQGEGFTQALERTTLRLSLTLLPWLAEAECWAV